MSLGVNNLTLSKVPFIALGDRVHARRKSTRSAIEYALGDRVRAQRWSTRSAIQYDNIQAADS